jgi:riboflavin biosynthesis pyrimidine reductase
MRRLFPDPVDDVDLSEAYAPDDLLPGPFVRLNMISSLDGAISVGGVSGPLGGSGDRQVFAAIRSHADVILVGAGTARAEGYGPARVSAADETVRVARGQDAQPRIAVVSGSLKLNWASPFFTDAHARPAVVTTSAAAARAPDEAHAVAELVAVGDDRVDLAAALAVFAGEGARTVLVEGGPGVNGDLARAGLIDELCLTVSPRVVGGDGARIMAGPAFDPPFAPVVRHILEDDGFLFLRMSLREAPEPPGT